MREATIHLSDAELADLGIGALVSVFRRAGLRRVSELQCRGSGCLLVVTVEDAVAEDRLDARSEVEWWERIDDRGSVAYLCKVAVSDVGDAVEPYHETDVAQRGIDPTEEGLDVTILGSHEAIGERVREYEAAGADVLLRAMSDYEGPDDPLDAATPRQREVLRAAFDRGYFDVPRGATTEEVGDALGLDPSTVREHLQRAQRNVFAALLSDGR
ncbi:helix-turn-helix domain-containing protein [Halobellus rubicundus]|uniref:Helix-turn-helix domain-containing protein n=1 Tax=Halobellus rubicundus TaxID=2996466 RepID=A0ABD5M7V7_9EURY